MMRHILTWYGYIQRKHINSQSNYIFVPETAAHQREFLKNARDYGGITYPSDHKLVLATLYLRAVHFKRKPIKPRVANSILTKHFI